MDRIRQEDGVFCNFDAIAGGASSQDDNVLVGTLELQPNDHVTADNQVQRDHSTAEETRITQLEEIARRMFLARAHHPQLASSILPKVASVPAVRFDLRSVFRAIIDGAKLGEGQNFVDEQLVLPVAHLRQVLAESFKDVDLSLLGHRRDQGREGSRTAAFPLDENKQESHGDDIALGEAGTEASTTAADAAAAEVVARIVGDMGARAVGGEAMTAQTDTITTSITPVGERGGKSIDYRRFEDWVLPARDVSELRIVLADLVEDGAALGLTVADLFAHFRGGRAATMGSDCRVTGCGHDGEDNVASREPDGIMKRQLLAGLGALSVYLTETEAERLLRAGKRGESSIVDIDGDGSCGGSGSGDDEVGQLSFDKFLALVDVKGSRGEQQHRRPRSDETRNKLMSMTRVGRTSRAAIFVKGDDDASPDSLTATTPRMPLPLPPDLEMEEVAAAASASIGPDTASSSAAAHVEAFGRVAADVRAVLTTAVSSTAVETNAGREKSRVAGRRGSDGGRDRADGGEQGTAGGDKRGSSDSLQDEDRQSNRSSSVPPLDSRRAFHGSRGACEQDGRHNDEEAVLPVPQCTPWSHDEDSVPLPLTRAITPPYGPARFPSALLHPTRTSRERLNAALETLELKERLRPTDRDITVQVSTAKQKVTRSQLPVRVTQKEGTGRTSGNDSLCTLSSRRPMRGSDCDGGSRRSTEGAKGNVTLGRRRRGDGAGASAATTVGAQGREKEGDEQTRRGSFWDMEYGDEGVGSMSLEAAETVGRLRSRVAELELSEQLLRCEVEGLRADIVHNEKRATAAVTTTMEQARDWEQALQARMGVRLRAAEAEIASLKKAMAKQKRCAAEEASAREKSSAEYLRRRLKEAEAALEAKAERRSSANKRNRNPLLRRRAWETQGAECSGAGRMGTSRGMGRNGDWSQGTVDRDGRGGFRTSSRKSSEDEKLRQDLDACRKKLATAVAEIIKLRREAAIVDPRKKERSVKSISEEEKKGEGEKGRSALPIGGKDGTRDVTLCVCACGGAPVGQSWADPHKTAAAQEKRQRHGQRQRERGLVARLAQSEDARIQAEADAGRLQAFIDEMRELLPLPLRSPVSATTGGRGFAAE